MAISFSCPSCDRRIQVKDEFTGRRGKCPGCGNTSVVPAADDESDEAVEKPRPKRGREHEEQPRSTRQNSSRRERDEDDEPRSKRNRRDRDDGRPRKKKKKAPQSSPVLIYAVVGAAVLVLAGVVVYICMDGKKDNEKERKGNEIVSRKSPPDSERKRSPLDSELKEAEGSGRKIPADEIRTDLKMIGLGLMNWYGANQNPPTKADDLAPHIGLPGRRALDRVSSGQITVIWGVPREKFQKDHQALSAFETEPDRNGVRFVLEALGSVALKDEREFAAAKKVSEN